MKKKTETKETEKSSKIQRPRNEKSGTGRGVLFWVKSGLAW